MKTNKKNIIFSLLAVIIITATSMLAYQANTSNLIVAGFHLWFIFFWNFVGFLFSYGVWIPYLG